MASSIKQKRTPNQAQKRGVSYSGEGHQRSRARAILSSALVLSLSILFLLSGCGTGTQGQTAGTQTKAATPKDNVTVMLDWTPNTNHTGLYVAADKGYFTREGLAVHIVPPASQGTVEQLVATGKADFGISAQEQVTYAREQGLPLVSIATIIQHNTSGFASLASKNLRTAKDFEGKTYGGWGLPSEAATIKALMAKGHADFSKVKMINIGDADPIASLTKGDIDFTWIFYGWEGIQAQLAGIPLNMIWVKDINPALDDYTPIIVTNENMIQKKPDVVRRFMKAVSEGYDYAIKNPAQAADILIKYAPETNPELIRKSQAWLSPRYQADASQWGLQKASVWHNYAQWMYDNKLLGKMIDTNKAFTNAFLPQG
ncbi:SsuA/THI5-like [Acididesulfobacillus acetoxydans]|uniref:NMT1/THI5 like protein n=1 Tax=Acididesulfobacillus acetoxydans TaxID=1561005 RepID=A0A8S0XBY2_9FIRM|nr:ABC transporter substrate-binding protein [Acididesulfobacillus acetoxydans]CAA7601766.1 SsuA/THI5-like [Acididesulfobacillus acetoxydans]CEJ09015.1 NMT1/THI5 like protein [Acididesulfobacillus acetoxydans]